MNRDFEERRWWQKAKSDIGRSVYEEVERIDKATIERQQTILESCALYGDMGSWPGSAGLGVMLPGSRRVSHNVIATATDALVAEVTQSIPRPMAVTLGGNFEERSKAKKLTNYWDAKFDETDTHDKARQCVRDCILGGLGVLHPYRDNPLDPENDKVVVERVFPGHFLIDDRSSVDVHPRQCYIRRFIDRSYLMELFPEHKNAIRMAEPPTNQYWFSPDNQSDVVEVIEAWHLASRPGSKDGMHVIVVSDICVIEEEYDRDRFPLAFVRPVPPQRGFWGENLVQRAAPAQFELNKLLRRIQESMHLHAVPRVFLQRQSGIVHAHMQNDVGIMVEYDGNPPQFLTPASMGADVYNYVVQLEEWIYREMGVSELSATSKKPPGLDSGAALRTYNDVQSRRWINLQRSYERMLIELAREFAYLEQEIASEYSKHEVSYNDRKYVKQVYWKDIHLDEARYNVRVHSASALPNTPAGKLQALEEMVKVGIIDQKTFIKLADVPDLESVRDLIVAPQELLEETFDSMLNGGKYMQPEPGMDLVLGRHMATLMIQRGVLDGVPESNIEKVRQWISDSLQLEIRAQRLAQKELMAEQQNAMADQLAQSPSPPIESEIPNPELAGEAAALAPELGNMEVGSVMTEGTARLPIPEA